MNNPFQKILIFIGILLILILAYFPTISNTYVHHDDVKFFLKTPFRPLIPDFYNNVFFGRPLGALRLTTYNIFINQASDLTFFRALNILILALCAFILIMLRNYGTKEQYIQTALVSLIIFTLPAFQILVAFIGICATPFALLFAILAAKYVHKTLCSLIFLFISLLFYPPIAMFYWVIVAGEIIFFQWNDPRQSMKRLARLFFTGFAGLGLYGLYLKCTKNLFSNLTVSGYDPYSVDLNIVSKLSWFIQEPLFNAINLWNIFPNQQFAYVLFLLILGAGAIRLIQVVQSRNTQELPGRIALVILFLILFPLAFLPNLAPAKSLGFYRCLLPLSALTFITIVWAINVWLTWLLPKRSRQLMTYILVISLAVGIFWCNRNIYLYRAKPSSAEFEYVKNKLKDLNLNELKSIHIIRPELRQLKVRYDEFATPTSFYDHDIVPLITCVIKELNRELRLNNIELDFEQHLFKYTFLDQKNFEHTYFLKITSSASSHQTSTNVASADLTIDTSHLYQPGSQLDYLSK